MEVLDMTKINEYAKCPECGKSISESSYTLECDYCLSKREE